MAEARVAITGLGVISPAGIGVEALWEALLARTNCTRAIDAFDPGGFPCRIGGQVDGFSARDYVPKTYRKSVKTRRTRRSTRGGWPATSGPG